MPIFQRPRSNILEAYIRADDNLDLYSREGSKKARQFLNASADVLCDALGGLVKDREFWDEIEELGNALQTDPRWERDILPLVRDLNALSDLESRVLRSAGVPRRKIEKIMSELLAATSLAQPTPEMLLGLRRRLKSAAKAICKVSRSGRGSAFRRLYIVSNGVFVAGGVGLIIANGVATIAMIPACASIVAGAQLAITRMEAMERFLRETGG